MVESLNRKQYNSLTVQRFNEQRAQQDNCKTIEEKEIWRTRREKIILVDEF
jgi:hypothetical protein